VGVSRTEVAVFGAGVTGLSVGYGLLRRGVDFQVFEAGVPGSGQSAGRTRVFRHGHDDERLVSLALRARVEWEGLERELGVRLLGRQGVLICGPNVAARAAALEAAGVPARLLDRPGLTGALPVISPPEDEALLDELGGSIDVRATVDGLAAALGDRLVSATVFGVRPGAERTELHTSEGVVSAQRVLVCAGGQVHPFAKELGLDIPLTIELHTRASFRVREPGPSLACLQDRSNVHGETVYAAPMPDGREYAIGLGTEHEPPVDEALARLSAYVEHAMPGLEREPASVRLCQTSILPWGADAFAVWQAGKVAVLAGANLFKFAPLLGELLAENSLDELSPKQRLGGAGGGVSAPSSPAADPART
jgi:glycine/D-amino acid oxidase-like deaminating enzyme